MLWRHLTILVAMLSAAKSTSIAAPTYSARVLHQYGAVTPAPRESVTSTVPSAISDTGLVVAATGEAVPLDRAADEYVNQAHAINEHGAVVGVGQRVEQDTSFAKLWLEGVGHDLNALVSLPEYHLTEAVDINERGQILVLAFREVQPGIQQGFTIVLNPVPEPASVATALIALLAAGICTRYGLLPNCGPWPYM
jgi:uncharacterized membrane protein